MSWRRALGTAAALLVTLPIVALLVAPLLVVVAVSLSPSSSFSIPVDAVSLRWYAALAETEGLWRPLETSLLVAAVATVCSLVLGTLCSVGLHGARFPGREAIVAALLSPLMLPGIVIGIAIMQGFRAFWPKAALLELVLAHIVLTLPYIVRVVMTALAAFDFSLIDAARTLGLSHPAAIRKVLVPNIMPAVATGAVFAFLASFDNYAVSMFLVDARTMTLPIKMLEFVEELVDPRLAAISTVLIAMSLAGVLLTGRLIGRDRSAGI